MNDETLPVDVLHEFNNMLTIMLGGLEQLHRQPLDEDGQRQLERVQWAARQTSQLAEQILSLGGERREAGTTNSD